MTPPTYDFSGILDALGGLTPAFVTAGAAVAALGLVVMGIKWGYPQLTGLFKKTAK